ncbi:hypothetical protein KPL71_000842 [Citrus sinensis]|uniref:Uncharacterized protein n=1 Tax=Citrus sinensis TaxID=2711 RepID=A0ACB8NS00_CITSI|nr:hypothetical protein KPL71_000842 [Citrus sinensis]
MVAEKIEDPLERPKLKHKRLPKAFGPPHEPLMDFPPQPTTVEDQQVPKAFYLAEKKTTEAVAMRLKVQKEMLMKEKERMDQQLMCLDLKARSAGATGAARQDDVM